jgi:hypothetical protein
MIAPVVIVAVILMAGAGTALARFTLSGRSIGLDTTYARHGRNQPAHVQGHPGYELSDYEAFTRAILKARMIQGR